MTEDERRDRLAHQADPDGYHAATRGVTGPIDCRWCLGVEPRRSRRNTAEVRGG